RPGCLHGCYRIPAEILRPRAQSYPLRYAAGQAVGVGGQWRIERPMISGLVAHDIDDPTARAARIVQVRQTVGQTGPAMQQCARGFAGDTIIPVGHAGDNIFLEPEGAMDTWALIHRSNEMHFAGARVCKTSVDACGYECFNKASGAIHGLSPYLKAT